ncbi:MAG TPA: PRC-barrel domain-containing protein [Hyphomicrobiaceae bacterium]|nr:PRC-barrel domain-containing protein [Hyphomicrobiaceae bacterium]
MHRRLIAAAVLFLMAAALPAIAQPSTQQPAQPPPKAKPQGGFTGLPLYTSDGKVIGRVLALGVDEDNETVVVAEIERSLGLGPTAIAVPLNLINASKGRTDRVELTLTEAEVNARLRRR